MILTFGINAIMSVMFLLLGWIEIPLLPAFVASYIAEFGEYLCAGAAILSNYVHLEYLLSLLMIVLAVDGAVIAYKFIMWVLRKIPMLGLS